MLSTRGGKQMEQEFNIDSLLGGDDFELKFDMSMLGMGFDEQDTESPAAYSFIGGLHED